jgi:hypothetical protein
MHKALSLAVAACALANSAAAQTAPLAPVEQTTLARDAFATGVLGRDDGALGPDLWRGADAAMLAALLRRTPASPSSPSIGAAARRVLLSPGEAPQGSSAALGGAKLKALVRLGFIDEAREIEALAIGGRSDAGTLEAMASADFLSGDVAEGCAKVQRIGASGDSIYGAKLRVVCYAIGGELDAADIAYGLLRERGQLTTSDEEILGPLAAGGKPKTGAEPVDPIHFAALIHAGTPLSFWPSAEAGLQKAVATNANAGLPVRLSAARRAAAMGVMSAASLKELFNSPGLDVAAVAGGAEAFRQRPDDATALAAAYQLAKSKSAPEFARDRAALVAGVIGAATDFDTLFTASALFAEDIRGFDGLLVSAREAEAFALARLALGDIAGAERWLGAGAAGGLTAGESADVAALLSAVKAGRIDLKSGEGAVGPHAEAALAEAVDAVIEAAGERIAGQGALAALAASGLAAAGHPVADVVVSRGLSTAGFDDLARRRTIERLLQQGFARSQPAQPAARPEETSAAPKTKAPRVKPAPSR